jgi:hypothetical protein
MMRWILLSCTTCGVIHFKNKTTSLRIKSTDAGWGSVYGVYDMTIGVQSLHEADGQSRHLYLLIHQTTYIFVLLSSISLCH